MRYTDLLFELLPPDELTEWSECWKKITQASEKIKARYGDISASDIEDTSKLFKEDEIIAPLFQDYNTAYKRAEEIENHAKELYYQDRAGDIDRIKKDAKLIIESISYNEFINFANEQALGGNLKDEDNNPAKESLVMQIFLKIYIGLQVEALTRYGHTAETLKHFADEYIAAKIKQWQSKDFKEINTNYPRHIPTDTFFEKGGTSGTFPSDFFTTAELYKVMKQGNTDEKKDKLNDALTFNNSKYLATLDAANHPLNLPYVKATKKRLKELEEMKRSPLAPDIDKFLKLYSKAVKDKAKDENMPNSFSVSLKKEELYKCLGYDVELHTKDTDTEKTKQTENDRVKNTRGNAGRRVSEILSTVQSFIIPFPIQKDNGYGYMDAVIIQASDTLGEYIIIYPSEAFYNAMYSVSKYRELTLADLSLPANNPTAYYVMDKLRERWGMDNNRNKGEHNRLSVNTLLQVTQLPTYEKCRQQRASWKTRIQAPFENALNFLKDNGNIISWEYKQSGGKPISKDLLDKQGRIDSYFVWIDTLIFFEIPESEELKKATEERIRKNTEKRAKAEEKKAKTKTTRYSGKKSKNNKKKAVNP